MKYPISTAISNSREIAACRRLFARFRRFSVASFVRDFSWVPRSLWGVEPRTKALCKVETTKDIVDGLVDFYHLVFHFIYFSLVGTRAILPLCTGAHMQALMTRVGGDNLTIVCIFGGT